MADFVVASEDGKATPRGVASTVAGLEQGLAPLKSANPSEVHLPAGGNAGFFCPAAPVTETGSFPLPSLWKPSSFATAFLSGGGHLPTRAAA